MLIVNMALTLPNHPTPHSKINLTGAETMLSCHVKTLLLCIIEIKLFAFVMQFILDDLVEEF